MRTSARTSTAASGENGRKTVLVDLGELLSTCFWASCSLPPEFALLRRTS